MKPDIADAIVTYAVFLFSVTLHEASHAWVAQKEGDDTAAEQGLVTINPIPHIQFEPVGMVLIPLFALFRSGGIIGWGAAPFDPRWAMQYPRRAAIMALAGPVANLFIFLVSAILIQTGIALGFLTTPPQFGFFSIAVATAPAWEGVAHFLSAFYSMNLLLFILNMLPIPPLDGFSIMTLFLPEETARKALAARSSGMVYLIGFIVMMGLASRILPEVRNRSANLMYPWEQYGPQ